jgi:arsenate reductase
MHPAKELNPLVPEILRLARYPTDGLHPKSWQDFARADAPPLDFVFTLCDPDAGEPRAARLPLIGAMPTR